MCFFNNTKFWIILVWWLLIEEHIFGMGFNMFVSWLDIVFMMYLPCKWHSLGVNLFWHAIQRILNVILTILTHQMPALERFDSPDQELVRSLSSYNMTILLNHINHLYHVSFRHVCTATRDTILHPESTTQLGSNGWLGSQHDPLERFAKVYRKNTRGHQMVNSYSRHFPGYFWTQSYESNRNQSAVCRMVGSQHCDPWLAAQGSGCACSNRETGHAPWASRAHDGPHEALIIIRCPKDLRISIKWWCIYIRIFLYPITIGSFFSPSVFGYFTIGKPFGSTPNCTGWHWRVAVRCP